MRRRGVEVSLKPTFSIPLLRATTTRSGNRECRFLQHFDTGAPASSHAPARRLRGMHLHIARTCAYSTITGLAIAFVVMNALWGIWI